MKTKKTNIMRVAFGDFTGTRHMAHSEHGMYFQYPVASISIDGRVHGHVKRFRDRKSMVLIAKGFLAGMKAGRMEYAAELNTTLTPALRMLGIRTT